MSKQKNEIVENPTPSPAPVSIRASMLSRIRQAPLGAKVAVLAVLAVGGLSGYSFWPKAGVTATEASTMVGKNVKVKMTAASVSRDFGGFALVNDSTNFNDAKLTLKITGTGGQDLRKVLAGKTIEATGLVYEYTNERTGKKRATIDVPLEQIQGK